MEGLGGDQGFAFSFLPASISILLKSFNNSYEELGNARNKLWKDPYPSGLTNPGFGAWMNATQPKYNATNFTNVEMKGLYGVLGNQSLLFGETDKKNTTLKADCKWDRNPVQQSCGFLAQMLAVGDLEFQNQTNTTKFKTLSGLILKTLCPSDTTQCFNRTNLFKLILPYIQHVNKYTMFIFVGERYELVTTRPQRDLALGYTMTNSIKPFPVPGIVQRHTNESVAKTVAKKETMYTCKAGDSKKYQWAGEQIACLI